MVQITLYGAGRRPCAGRITQPANRQAMQSPLVHSSSSWPLWRAMAAIQASRASMARSGFLAPREALPRPALHPGLEGTLGRIGSLEIRLARTKKDIKR